MSSDHCPTLYDCALNCCSFITKLVPQRRRLLLKDQFFKGRYEQIQKKIHNQNHESANLVGASICFNSGIFVGDKRPLGEPRKKFGPLGPPQKCPKIQIISRSSLFLAILESLDTPKIYSQLGQHPLYHLRKFQSFPWKNVFRKNIFVKCSNLEPILHCMLNAQK